MSAPSAPAGLLRRAPTALTLVPALLALVVVVLAFTDLARSWDDLASYRPAPPPEPVPAPTLTARPSPYGPLSVVVDPNTQVRALSAVTVGSSTGSQPAAALVLAGCALAAVRLVRRRSYGTAALVSAFPLMLHAAAAVIWTAGLSAPGRFRETLAYTATRPFAELFEGPQRWLGLIAIAVGAVNAVVLARRHRGHVAVRGLVAAQAVLAGLAIVLSLLPSVLPGQERPFDHPSEPLAVPFGAAVIAAAVLATVLHRDRARRPAPVILLAPLLWLVWTLIPWTGGPEYLDPIGEIGSFPGSLEWAGVAESLQVAAWLVATAALLLSAAGGVILARRRP